MGICFSSSGIADLSEEDRYKHREAEKLMKEVRPLPSLPCQFCILTSFTGKGQNG